jgi:O-antigen/teichoic acid export membrane protein
MLKQKAINGVKWTTLSSAVNALLQLLQLMILARFLSVHDFGLMAILMVVIGFSQIFVDFGLSKAIVYKKDISAVQLSTLYWLNILFGLVIFSMILLFTNPIANFYHEPQLEQYISLVSITVIIQSFGLQYRALFQKELKFNLLAKIDILSAFISFVTAISLSFLGYGIYALILPALVMVSLKTILLIVFGYKEHKPKLIFNLSEIKEFISFGTYSTGNGIVSTIATQIDIILIGKILGTESLGLYSVIKELLLRPAELINPIITKVAFPVMSKVNHDINEVKKIYLKLINYIASVNFPIYIASFLLATELISIFLGEKWLSGVYIFQVLTIWALIRSIGNPIGSLVMAMGKPQIEMFWNMAMMIFMPVVVLISSLFGIQGIAYGNVIAIILLFVPGWYFLVFKLCGATLNEYFSKIFYPLAMSIGIGSIVFFGLYLFEIETQFVKILFVLIVGGLLTMYANKKLNNDFYNMIISLVKR